MLTGFVVFACLLCFFVAFVVFVCLFSCLLVCLLERRIHADGPCVCLLCFVWPLLYLFVCFLACLFSCLFACLAERRIHADGPAPDAPLLQAAEFSTGFRPDCSKDSLGSNSSWDSILEIQFSSFCLKGFMFLAQIL